MSLVVAIAYYVLYRLLVPVFARISDIPREKKNKQFCAFCFDSMSIVHALFAFCTATYALTSTGFQLNSENELVHEIVQIHSLGYFIFDTIIESLLSDLLTNKLMLAHHACCLTPLLYMLPQQCGGAEIAIALFLAECSNPFILIRNLYKHAEWPTDSTFYKVNEIVFAVSFIVTRGVIIPFALYLTYTGDKVPRMLKVFCSGLTFISFLWIF